MSKYGFDGSQKREREIKWEEARQRREVEEAQRFRREEEKKRMLSLRQDVYTRYSNTIIDVLNDFKHFALDVPSSVIQDVYGWRISHYVNNTTYDNDPYNLVYVVVQIEFEEGTAKPLCLQLSTSLKVEPNIFDWIMYYFTSNMNYRQEAENVQKLIRVLKESTGLPVEVYSIMRKQ